MGDRGKYLRLPGSDFFMVEDQAVSLLIFDHGLLNIIGPAVGLHNIAEFLRKIPEIQCAGIFFGGIFHV